MAVSISKLSRVIPDLVTLNITMTDLINFNEREAIIIGCGIIEATLEEAIISKFHSQNEDFISDIRKYDGPLSTFSQKIKIARAFGVISDTIYFDIEKIRSIRNVYAHSIIVPDMESPPICDSIKSLKILENFKSEELNSMTMAGGEVLDKRTRRRDGGYFKIKDKIFSDNDYEFMIDAKNRVFCFIPHPQKSINSTGKLKIIAAMQACWFLIMPFAILRLIQRASPIKDIE